MLVHRIATSDAYSSGLREIYEWWTIAEVMQAIDYMDARAAAEAAYYERKTQRGS